MRSNSPHKIRAYKAGLFAEVLAAGVLFFKGYRILCCRFKVGQGEVDIVAVKGDSLVAVEVKARSNLDLALEAVTPANRRRVENAALRYLALNERYAGHTLRFDIIAVSLKSGLFPVAFKHIEDAWPGRH